MFGQKNDFSGIKMCLSHSQSRVERGLCELEIEFKQWQAKPASRSLRSKLLEDLENFRWLLDQHFTRVAGEGYLERCVHHEPSLYTDFRDIECWQARLIDHLDSIIESVRHTEENPDAINSLVREFVRLHDDILREENEERYLVEKALG